MREMFNDTLPSPFAKANGRKRSRNLARRRSFRGDGPLRKPHPSAFVKSYTIPRQYAIGREGKKYEAIMQ